MNAQQNTNFQQSETVKGGKHNEEQVRVCTRDVIILVRSPKIDFLALRMAPVSSAVSGWPKIPRVNMVTTVAKVACRFLTQ